jgi:hypothetical protein
MVVFGFVLVKADFGRETDFACLFFNAGCCMCCLLVYADLLITK